MRFDCLLAGVGGQGTVLASRLIAQSAMDGGFAAHTSETIGMAQRGGSVTSQVRLGGGDACAPAIPKGQADFIIGFEPAEALRNIAYLSQTGKMLINICPLQPVTSSLGGGYDLAGILSALKQFGSRQVFIDGNKLCRAAGSAKVMNVIMLGIAAREKMLPFSPEQLERVMLAHVPARFAELNRKAFSVGLDYQNMDEGLR